jgi:hypothetical protein
MQKLFDQLRNLKSDSKIQQYFQDSGIINRFDELKYGFFPLGNGVLSSEENPDKKFKIMILGNDFGTNDYLESCINNEQSESDKNPTIRNLKKLLGSKIDETFFTNFHLGVRYKGTNTKRDVPVSKSFQDICYSFFLKQLDFINPEIIICLGQEVRDALISQSEVFSLWKSKNISIKKLYETDKYFIDIKDSELGNRQFIIVTHPCDLRNFKPEYIGKIQSIISK